MSGKSELLAIRYESFGNCRAELTDNDKLYSLPSADDTDSSGEPVRGNAAVFFLLPAKIAVRN